MVSVSSQLPEFVGFNPREALEQRRNQLKCSGGGIAFSTPERQVGRTTVATVASDQHCDRFTPGDGVSRYPCLTVLALVLDPQITGL